MAARKLQTEIDRTLKKVSEGVELFESIYDKMTSSTNQTQKEKLELDLKSQIKKLQRLRDQIKTWVASNDIKDKTALVDNRRLIETQMEKFKACEKEMKTKAFSKEGLIAAARLDPREQEREEVTVWLQTQVEELQMQVEQGEAEIESLQGSVKKRNKSGTIAAGRVDELEHSNERRKWHISRLEIVLRLVNNGSITADRVKALQDDVSFFVESNTDEDFEEDDGIYDELNLDEEEEKFGLVADDDEDSDESDAGSDDMPPRTPSKKHDEESVSSGKRDDGSPVMKKAAVTLQLRKQSISTVETKPPPTPNFKEQPMSSILKANVPPARPPIRYAAAAAAAVAPPQNSSAATSTPPATATLPPAAPSQTSLQSSASQDLSHIAPVSPSLTHPSAPSPMLSSAASLSQQPEGSFYSGQESPEMSEALASPSMPMSSSPTNVTSNRKDSIPTASPIQPTVPSPLTSPTDLNGSTQPPATASPLPQQVQYAPNTTASISSPLQPGQAPLYPPGFKGAVGDPTTVQRPDSQRQPYPGLSDLVMSFENVKQKAAMRMSNLDQVHKTLDSAHASKPDPRDTEKPKYYVPTNPFQTAVYYPQTPHTLLNTAGVFSQLDVETLFYVFYYCPGTYQQYLAAKELKRQSWRFHVKYLTWFQRHSEPQAITEEYEQGVYVYFDWEGSWCQRKKSDFRFEYRYLSED